MLRWSSGNGIVSASFSDDLDDRDQRLRYRTAISTSVGDGVSQMLRDADACLDAVRGGGQSDAGGLVVACDIQHAREVAVLMRRELGCNAAVVVSDDPEASLAIDRFAKSSDRWLVAVNMVSEGVDIPRLRVGVYASAIRMPLFFRQVVGRFVRVRPGLPAGPSHLFLPADSALHALAREIELEMHHALVPEPDAEDSLPLEGRELSAASFVPLSAEVEASATIMGGTRFSDPDQAAAVETLARTLALDPAEVLSRLGVMPGDALSGSDSEPDFVAREKLRRRRKRLVGQLHHATGRGYEEIQRQINAAVAGGRGVDRQSLRELGAGVRLLEQTVAGDSDSPLTADPALTLGRT